GGKHGFVWLPDGPQVVEDEDPVQAQLLRPEGGDDGGLGVLLELGQSDADLHGLKGRGAWPPGLRPLWRRPALPAGRPRWARADGDRPPPRVRGRRPGPAPAAAHPPLSAPRR